MVPLDMVNSMLAWMPASAHNSRTSRSRIHWYFGILQSLFFQISSFFSVSRKPLATWVEFNFLVAIVWMKTKKNQLHQQISSFCFFFSRFNYYYIYFSVFAYSLSKLFLFHCDRQQRRQRQWCVFRNSITRPLVSLRRVIEKILRYNFIFFFICLCVSPSFRSVQNIIRWKTHTSYLRHRYTNIKCAERHKSNTHIHQRCSNEMKRRMA